MSISLRQSLFPIFLVAIAVLGLSACDIGSPLEDVELVLDVEDASVAVGNVTTEVRSDRPTARTEEANPDLGVKDVQEVRSVRLKPEYFTFASAGENLETSKASASGTLEVWVFFGSYPLPGLPLTLTIENDVVTDISPTALSFAGETYAVNADGLNQLLEELGTDAPDLAAWETASMSEVEAAINDALQAQQSPFSIAVRVTEGNLSGSLTVDQFSVDAQVAK